MDEPAERLEVNPYEQRCPDFTSAAFRGIRDTMLAAQPDIDPVAQMIAAWEAGNNNYGLISTTDGLQFKSLTDLKAYKKVVPDENLSWSEVAQARSVLLHEMNTMGYPDAIINSFHAFFYNLEMHSVRHKTYGEQILVQYQADVRREYYDRLEQKRELFDIAIIDEAVMMQCEDKVRDRVEADRATTFARAPGHSFQGAEKGSGKPTAACAICLSREYHVLSKCDSPTIFDGSAAYASRNDQGRIVDKNGIELCMEWQRPNGCPSRSRSHRHDCSGCGRSDHGANNCPRAEKA
ncbi:hypothetical protein EUX98_g5575 [Antrodiella citrinella]|uniref:CCHC-type domain-containing protein n=1 Tax=Antrodiella citrinella TaxID=2447956 RepID=A0A4S4MR80_9APHY|nr:hypothetical protein EUX98_g5575 [Antrodiella citrinella]